MSDHKSTSPREILRRVWLDGAKLTPSMTVDEALAAIAAYYEGLLPEKPYPNELAKQDMNGYYRQGYAAAIDTIRRNFKGGR